MRVYECTYWKTPYVVRVRSRDVLRAAELAAERLGVRWGRFRVAWIKGTYEEAHLVELEDGRAVDAKQIPA